MGVIGVKLCEKNIFRVKVSLPRLPALWVVHGCGNTVFACNAFFEISLAKYLSQFWRKNSMETSGRNLQTFIVESFTSMESFELSPRSLMEISSWKLVQLMKHTFQPGTDSWELAAYYYYVFISIGSMIVYFILKHDTECSPYFKVCSVWSETCLCVLPRQKPCIPKSDKATPYGAFK